MLKYTASKPLFRSAGSRTPFFSPLLHSWSALLLLMKYSALPAPALAQQFSIDELDQIRDAAL